MLPLDAVSTQTGDQQKSRRVWSRGTVLRRWTLTRQAMLEINMKPTPGISWFGEPGGDGIDGWVTTA